MPSKSVVGNWPRQSNRADVELRWSDLALLLRDIAWPEGSGVRHALMLVLFFGLTAVQFWRCCTWAVNQAPL